MYIQIGITCLALLAIGVTVFDIATEKQQRNKDYKELIKNLDGKEARNKDGI